MFDAGAGAAEQADLPLLAGWRYGRTTPLSVYGSVRTSGMVEGFNQAYYFDKKY